MDSSSNHADMLRKSMTKKKKQKGFQSTDSGVDPAFLRDMGYGSKKKMKGKKVPLKSGKKNFKNNVKEMMKAGHPQKQALAAAYSKARESSSKSRKKGK